MLSDSVFLRLLDTQMKTERPPTWIKARESMHKRAAPSVEFCGLPSFQYCHPVWLLMMLEEFIVRKSTPRLGPQAPETQML